MQRTEFLKKARKLIIDYYSKTKNPEDEIITTDNIHLVTYHENQCRSYNYAVFYIVNSIGDEVYYEVMPALGVYYTINVYKKVNSENYIFK